MMIIMKFDASFEFCFHMKLRLDSMQVSNSYPSPTYATCLLNIGTNYDQYGADFLQYALENRALQLLQLFYKIT